jgi:methylmalonyl-CoA mutase cobalamin-binding domain/chain
LKALSDKMYTHKSRILAAFRGEQVDVLPYVPRIDLWYLANKAAGTLPPQHAHRTQNEISRAEGWALHHKYAYSLVGETVDDGLLHRGIGIYQIRDALVDFVWPKDLQIAVRKDGDRTTVEYRTPVGRVSCTMQYNDSMERLGISIPHITRHLVESPQDYGPACWLFEHLDVVPNYERFKRWSAEEIGEHGVPVAVAFHGASPMQQIQRDLIDATQFFFHYKDHYARLRELADRMEPLYDKILSYSVASPADVVMWGVNFDDMLTYPPYFEREIQPWIRKAAEALGPNGKLVMCHTDGENRGLMDLIRDSGMHVAESICPAPMGNVTLEEYYRRWSGHLTLMGGIPSTVVLPETSEADFEAFLDEMFRVVAPGTRMVVGIADQVPPKAIFSRLQRIGERVAREGRLPLAAGGFRPADAPPAPSAAETRPVTTRDGVFAQVKQDVLDGNQSAVVEHALALIVQGVPATEILDRGLIAAMDVIGRRFTTGEAFIPEVLLSARAMNKAVEALGPHLASSAEQRGKVLIGTVAGDMHDIGKNMVVTMLKGVGFEVKDLGINVPRETFVEEVSHFQPDILGLSALLTTTMTEMRHVIAALDEHHLRARCKVMVGGAPVSESFAHEIGADGWAGDAVGAVATAKRLMAAQPSVVHR